MDVLERFEVALDMERRGDGVPELLPAHLSRACAHALRAQGAGISLVAEIRVPLGWDNDETRVAEGLQATLGEGPCLSAVVEGRMVVADESSLLDRWPRFSELVLKRTSYRSLASVPLLLSPDLHGAVDAYWTGATAAREIDQNAAFHITGRVAELLLDGSDVDRDATLPPEWFDHEIPQRRLRLWTAAGLVAADLVLEPSAAVAAIRGWALEHDVLLDDAVDRLVTRTLTPRDLLWSEPD